MTGTRIRENLLLRIGKGFIGVGVDEWPSEAPRLTAIAVHDYAETADEMAPLAACLQADATRFIAPTMPGRAPSAFLGPHYAYDVATMLAVLVALATRYQSQRNCLIGSGAGGLLCLAAVRARLLRPQLLILKDVPPFGSGLDSRLKDRLDQRIRQGEKFDPQLARIEWPAYNFEDYFSATKVPTICFAAKGSAVQQKFANLADSISPAVKILQHTSPETGGILPLCGHIKTEIADIFNDK